MTIIRVLLIDDNFDVHQVVSAVLRRHSDIDLAGEGYDGGEALALCRQLRPDVLLLDVAMPVMNGIEASKLLREQFPDIKILVISNFQDDENVQAMLSNGADGYIDKGSLCHDLADNIRSIYHGKNVYSKEANSRRTQFPTANAWAEIELTKRQKEIMKLMVTGLNRREIAARLGLREATVKFHLLRIYAKLGAHNYSEALIAALKRG